MQYIVYCSCGDNNKISNRLIWQQVQINGLNPMMQPSLLRRAARSAITCWVLVNKSDPTSSLSLSLSLQPSISVEQSSQSQLTRDPSWGFPRIYAEMQTTEIQRLMDLDAEAGQPTTAQTKLMCVSPQESAAAGKERPTVGLERREPGWRQCK